MIALGLLLLVQQPQTPAPPAAVPSPIAKVVVTPAVRTLTAGDTLRLTAQALDSAGRAVPNAVIRFTGAGGRFEGRVDSTGLVYAGSTGTLGVAVLASVPGSRPTIERLDIKMLPGAAARLTVTPTRLRLVPGQSVLLEGSAWSTAGDPRPDAPRWRSSAPRVVGISADGLVTAVAPGKATITARVEGAEQTIPVEVLATAVAAVEIAPASISARQGDVIRFSLVARDRAGRPIEGLTPIWSFTPGQGSIDKDGAFVGYEAGKYIVTASLGSRAAKAVVSLAWRDVRRPATVVGRLPRSLFTTEEVWLHPNGKIAYLGSGGGGDRMYAIDISDPSNPVVTDSLVANTRRINDIMTTPDGKYLVHTREGASDRKNGIVLASLEDPAHPRKIAEFTDGVTGGVHSTFIYQQPKHGTHIYLTNDGTGYMHVIDINDPYHPKEVARWSTRPDQTGNALHDIDVQDGLAYLSYWNEGLVILDIGNGIKGGSPANPQLVSQFKYDLNELYRDVEASGGPGFIRGTHTAWRHGKYVFIADEVFPASGVKGAKDAASYRAYGRLQVVDVSDMEHPRSVAWYEPEYGGVHNVWVAGDTLYMGAYNAGFRAFDVSGELRGDLRAQGREIVHVNTADMTGKVQNSAMTWGVVVRDGLAYVNDDNNGLWIIRMEPRRAPLTP
ncbi:MAG: Ig-like domain-containing protein [Gemmatimonadetes bacterium]|nr:Ig-like domain-containing protein [Gemmatimonadota bacterium]MBK7783383.1 Ig-like domain-containing protein [Gemmatimonadota bacterium]